MTISKAYALGLGLSVYFSSFFVYHKVKSLLFQVKRITIAVTNELFKEKSIATPSTLTGVAFLGGFFYVRLRSSMDRADPFYGYG